MIDQRLDLANRQLQTAVELLERQVSSARFEGEAILALGNAAKLLRNAHVLGRAEKLLAVTPAEAFWEGAIHNLAGVLDRDRGFEAVKVLEKLYPPFDEQDLRSRIEDRGRSEPHIGLCISGEFEDSLSSAESELQMEETANTMAVRGRCDLALKIAGSSVTDRGRIKTILIVVAIELLRRGADATLLQALRDLEDLSPSAWDRIALALGFSQRRPWDIYPYSDY